MKFLIALLILFSSIASSFDQETPLSIGAISFTDAYWDNVYNIRYSRHRVSDLTNDNKAVILYLFEACFT